MIFFINAVRQVREILIWTHTLLSILARIRVQQIGNVLQILNPHLKMFPLIKNVVQERHRYPLPKWGDLKPEPRWGAGGGGAKGGAATLL